MKLLKLLRVLRGQTPNLLCLAGGLMFVAAGWLIHASLGLAIAGLFTLGTGVEAHRAAQVPRDLQD
jgi:hypothetical protein